MNKMKKLHGRGLIRAKASDKSGLVWEVVAVAPGFRKDGGTFPGSDLLEYYFPEDLKESAQLFDGIGMYAYGSHLTDDEVGFTKGSGIARDLVGYMKNPRWDERLGIVGEAHLFSEYAAFGKRLLESFDGGVDNLLELSYDGFVEGEQAVVDNKPVMRTFIRSVNTCDFVTGGALGGKLLRAAAAINNTFMEIHEMLKLLKTLRHRTASIAAKRGKGETRHFAQMIDATDADSIKDPMVEVLKDVAETIDTKEKAGQDMAATIEAIITKIKGNDLEGAVADLETLMTAMNEPAPEDEAAKQEAEKKAAADKEAAEKAALDEAAKKKAAEEAAKSETAEQKAAREAAEKEKAEKEKAQSDLNKTLDELKATQAAIMDAQNTASIEKTVGEAALPESVKPRVVASLKREFAGGKPLDQKRVTAAIREQQELLADLQRESGGAVSFPGVTTREMRVDAIHALRGMWKGEDVQNERGETVRQFASFVEAARAITGNQKLDGRDVFEMLGAGTVGQPRTLHTRHNNLSLRDSAKQRVRVCAEMRTTDLTSVYLNTMHNEILDLYMLPYLDDWKKIVKKVNLKDLYIHYFTRTGGRLGAVPSVGEGGTYQELSAITDEEITMTASKYGALAPAITLEMIMKDKMDLIRQIPAMLVNSIKEDIYDEVIDTLTTNGTIYDGAALFEAAGLHYNLGTTALSPAGLDAVRIAQRSRVPYGGAKPFGVANTPKFCLIPNELEKMSDILFKSDNLAQIAAATAGGFTSGTDFLPNTDQPNIHKGIEAIIVDKWTNAKDHYFVADPAKVPGILVGFLNGDETPELMMELGDTGEDFTADKKRHKVRQWRDSAVIDWRPFYYQDVA